MKLPEQFLNKMKKLMGKTEYEEFLESYNKPRYYGLRVNTLKISLEEFMKITPFELEPIPWTVDGFYYKAGENPGKHPYYHAGLYYIQEPSAMLPGSIINAKPGDRVLDLCAAPGGKTVQIAAAMKGQGLLVANDINSDRVKALVKNIELCGIKNAVVTNESPERLAIKFQGFFDKIVVDAPCSGEGMFRKDEDAAKSWESFKCEKCSAMQRDILKSVDKMLKPGGYFVYSTCTFSPEEDEMMLDEFLKNHPGYELCDTPRAGGIESGRPEWADGSPELSKAARLWPHRVKGEGHFAALLHKKTSNGETFNEVYENIASTKTYSTGRPVKDINLEDFNAFEKENLNIKIEGIFDLKGNNLYCLPEQLPDVSGLKIAKFGWYLGEFAKGRFEPSHSMVIALSSKALKNTISFDRDSKEVISYLKGETLMIEGKKGYTGICVDGYTLGFGKQTGDMIKNLYPKGWRKMN